MSGKAYTMREMKMIVEYLTEHKAYSEIKGRKMWMDFAASKLTNRTWQSLKECFIKRILPDISNPYFKLDVEQIHSFKRGLDLTEKDKNKLEFQPVDKESNHKDENGDVGQPSTSKANDEANATGEDTTCSKVVHNRASTETLILDNCYETVEELQKELERSTDDENEKVNGETKLQPTKSAAKSVRDFIVYSEPLTPMLQEVLDDFATDESDPPMEIDENYVNPDRRSNSPERVAKSQSILPHLEKGTAETTENMENKDNRKAMGEDKATDDGPTNNDKGKQADNESASKTADTTISQLEDVMVLVDEVLANHLECNVDSKNTESQDKTHSSNEASSVMTDTLLPNNQEAVNDNTFKANLPLPASDSNLNLKVSAKRKHSSSLEIIETKKRHVDNDQTVSKTDGNIEDKHEKISNPMKLNNIGSPKKKHNLTLNNTNSNTETTRNTQALVEQRKPSSNKEVEEEVNAENENNKNDLSSSQSNNLCLKSVSLYDEQFSSTKYSDVELNDKEDEPAQKPTLTEKPSENPKPKEDVILLKSRSNSESHDEPNVNAKTVDPSTMKLKKDKNLASIFGFVNGGSASKRLNSRKRTISHRKQHYESSESSEWTSASDSEYVSPPRGRRNRYARKYLKPKSARVRCLDEEGGLFVMLGNKIYPFVRDDKLIKNYVSFLPESDPEDEESYWKSKYVEEKKRTAELQKMVGQPKQNGITTKESSVSINPPPNNQHRPTSRRESANGLVVPGRDSESVEKNGQEETVKIKITKFDQEVQIEGHWQHLNPVLSQVVSLLKKHSVKPAEEDKCVELSSGTTTPVKNLPLDPGVQEKVNKMESDIFKEIKEMDEQEEKAVTNEKDENAEVKANGPVNEVEESKVTIRKKLGRPKKTGTPIIQSPAISKEPTEPATKSNDLERVKGQEIDEGTPNVATTRKSRTPRKLVHAPNETAATSSLLSKKTSPRKKSPAKETLENEDEEVRYKFPSPPPEKRRRKSANLSRKTKTSNNLKPKAPSPEALSHHSVNSSQGYQDSDASPFHINLRKKRRSISTLSYKGKKIKRKYRSKSYPLLKHTSDSSNSSFNKTKTVTREQSTVNSEVYRTDSYNFLMPRTRAIMEKLKKIDETENEINLEDLTALRAAIERGSDNFGTSKNDAASSSIVSLPSPELSIVESLTISKEALAIIGDYPSIEKSPNSSELDAFDKYLMSGVDVTMPLMGQECGLRESYRKHIMSALSGLTDDAPYPAGRNLPSFRSSAFKVSSISESILDKVSSANIDETADSLDKRLEELLLESVQKPKKPEKMEVDTQVKKKGSRKRCSTPNKKQAVRKKTKHPSEGILIEEECQTKCARNGRRSCPPSINIVYYENNAPDNLEINIHDQSVDVTTVTKRKSIKKDVIKVKILKPKPKPQCKKSPKRNFQTVSRTSGHTEYDNESGVFLQGFDESADLIHNHSETCLQTKDCMGDSVEFLEMASKSIYSVNSSDDSIGKVNVNVRAGTETLELFCDDAQCAVDFRNEIKSAGSGNTMFFTPLMSKNNSIITEDLSDASPNSKPEKSRPSKWYLVSEEESNFCDIPEEANDVPSFGANLKQIFPITCAIPELSTITEMSDKNFNSCSPKLDGDFLDS